MIDISVHIFVVKILIFYKRLMYREWQRCWTHLIINQEIDVREYILKENTSHDQKICFKKLQEFGAKLTIDLTTTIKVPPYPLQKKRKII